MGHLPFLAAIASAFLFGMATFADAQTPSPSAVASAPTGGYVFRTYCASCHGTAAKGDGPLADSMKRRPADLTEITKRNAGVFPAELVFRSIDGRQPVRGHGGPDMPVWGDAFSRASDGGDAEAVRAKIQSLVVFLESIQTKTTH
jgi:mono/diheme cytochrome c family protein